MVQLAFRLGHCPILIEHNDTPAEAARDRLFFANGHCRMWPEISRFDAWYVRD